MGMTPTDIENIARSKYNATNDTFFTSSEIQYFIWQASHILAREAWCIERVYTTTTVAGTQTYSFPTNTINIKRITANGKKLRPVTFRQDDALTLTNQAATTSGWPLYYAMFNFTLYLRPIPDQAYTLNIYSYNDAQLITGTSVLEVPGLFHMDVVDYVVGEMCAKDQQWQAAAFYQQRWNDHVLAARRWKAKQKRGDHFATVENEDILPVTILGEQ